MEPASKRRRVSGENSVPGEIDHETKRKPRVSRPSQLDAFSGVSVGNVYKSNLFKLKVDELLKQVTADYSQLEEPINTLLRTLKESIEAIPGRDPISVSGHEGIDNSNALDRRRGAIPPEGKCRHSLPSRSPEIGSQLQVALSEAGTCQCGRELCSQNEH
jgi:hypothetical protein